MILRLILSNFWPRHFLGKFGWYRSWYGGRWEHHYIEICASFIWLEVENPKHYWETGYRQPCSRCTPLIEHYESLVRV